MGAPRPKQLMPINDYVERRNSGKMSPEQRREQIDRTRASLLVWLDARRRRLGMTEQDIRESPENVLEKQKLIAQENEVVNLSELHNTQRSLLDSYMQSQASVDTMNYTQ